MDVERSCSAKVRYPSEAAAEEAIGLQEIMGRRGLRHYHCIFCRGVHLTGS